MGTEKNRLDKPTLEKEWANAEARLKLNRDDRSKWAEMGYTVRPYVYFDKILIIWAYQAGVPEIKDILTVTGLEVSLQDGMWLRTRSKVTQQEHIITHTPRPLAGFDIFAWIPYFNEVRYQSADWSNLSAPRNLRLSACFKMREDPQLSTLRSGQHCLSELHVFREQFPQYASTRF